MSPSRPGRPCAQSGCPTIVASGYCPAHQRETRKAVDQRRGSAASRGYGGRWRRARAAYLSANPVCVCPECKETGRVLPATVVDHIIPHKGDQALFWDTSNWQAMAKVCHDRKTAREDGGWGRPSGAGSR